MGVEQYDCLQRLSVLGKDDRIIAAAGNPALALGEHSSGVVVKQACQGGLVVGVLSIMIAEAQCPGSIVVLHEIGEFGEHFQTVEAEKEISAYDRQVGIGLHERLLKQGIEVFSTGKGSSAQVKVGSPQNGEGIPFIGYGEGLLFSYGLVKIERVLWYNKKFGMPVKVLKEFGVGQSVDDQIGGNSCCYETAKR